MIIFQWVIYVKGNLVKHFKMFSAYISNIKAPTFYNDDNLISYEWFVALVCVL